MSKFIPNECIFYHIYPIGFCGAPEKNLGDSTKGNLILKIKEHIPHMKELGINALYLGPIFESVKHGYDTNDYRLIDTRLGNNDDFKEVCRALKEEGIALVLDGVFNHVGRGFFAFEDVKKNREASPYCSWISGLHFNENNSYNDGFKYDAWWGHEELVKLNLKNPDVVNYLLDSVGMWIDEFDISGLRLDAADCIDHDFFKKLRQYTLTKKDDFWLMGEIIHGDYRVWANKDMLHSVTNYECYKGYYSGINSKNMYEPAFAFSRQSGEWGLYKDLCLYNFTDNHDVNRLASELNDLNNIQNIYTMMYTIPGTPSIYYGSEYAVKGKKTAGSDAPMRPCWDDIEITEEGLALSKHLSKLAQIKLSSKALKYGDYKQLHIESEGLVFSRTKDDETAVVMVNTSAFEKEFNVYAKNSNIYRRLAPFTSEIIIL